MFNEELSTNKITLLYCKFVNSSKESSESKRVAWVPIYSTIFQIQNGVKYVSEPRICQSIQDLNCSNTIG